MSFLEGILTIFEMIDLPKCSPKKAAICHRATIDLVWKGRGNRHIWLVLSDEPISKRWPFSLLNDKQISNWVGFKHLPNMNGINPLATERKFVTPEKKGPIFGGTLCCQDGTMPWKNEAFLGLSPTFQPTETTPSFVTRQKGAPKARHAPVFMPAKPPPSYSTGRSQIHQISIVEA